VTGKTSGICFCDVTSLSSMLAVGRSFKDAPPTWGESRAGFVPLWDGSLLGTAVTGKTSGICFCDVTSLSSALAVGRSFEDAPPTSGDPRAGLVPLCWDGSLLSTAATGGTTSGTRFCTSLSSMLAVGRSFGDTPPTRGDSRAGLVPLWDGSLLGTAATGGTTSGICFGNVTSLSSTLAVGRPFEDAPPTWGDSRAGFAPPCWGLGTSETGGTTGRIRSCNVTSVSSTGSAVLLQQIPMG